MLFSSEFLLAISALIGGLSGVQSVNGENFSQTEEDIACIEMYFRAGVPSNSKNSSKGTTNTLHQNKGGVVGGKGVRPDASFQVSKYEYHRYFHARNHITQVHFDPEFKLREQQVQYKMTKRYGSYNIVIGNPKTCTLGSLLPSTQMVRRELAPEVHLQHTHVYIYNKQRKGYSLGDKMCTVGLLNAHLT